jgi:DNA-binding transcriptional MocR family regulator
MPASSNRSSGASIDILWIPLVWAAFRRRELTPAHRDVLLRLPPFRGKGGLIFPSHETIAQRAGCSVSTVKRALEAGRALGLIDWRGVWRRTWGWASKRCSNLYSLIWAPTATVENPMKSDTGQSERVASQENPFFLTACAEWPDAAESRVALARIAEERGRKLLYNRSATLISVLV